MFAQRLFEVMQRACANTFAQQRTQTRAVELGMGTLCAFGRRTVSRSICAVGRQHQDWSADYKLFSRSSWLVQHLFSPVLEAFVARYPKGPLCFAMDDTKLPRAGRKVRTAFWQRDPLSPAFHVNLVRATRYMQVSALFAHHEEAESSPRGIPVRFVECPAVKKPGKRGTEKQWNAYRQARKVQNLSMQSLATIKELRTTLDAMGAAGRTMLMAVDGSLCNRWLYREPIAGVEFIGRCRKDAALCLPAPPGTRRKYAATCFTPEQVRNDATIAWNHQTVYYGGQRRDIRYKEVNGVLWRRGGGLRPLRLFVIAPQPYKNSPNGTTQYHQPAYLLATSEGLDVRTLLQCYFDRWQIEVNHRDEKEILGVGQSQVWAEHSVPRQPAFAVASYSLMMLAALEEFGPTRTDQFIRLPKWRRHAKRYSALDAVALLREQINEMQGSTPLCRAIAQNTRPYAYT